MELRWVRGLKGEDPQCVPTGGLWHPERHARDKYRTRAQNMALRGAETKVLDYLLNGSDSGLKPYWPSQERMADDLHLNERTVERAVARLKELGLIVVDVCQFVQPCEPREGQRRTNHSGYRRIRTNRYYFVIHIADHRGLLSWFRRQVRPAPNPGAGPQQIPDSSDGASVVNLDGTVPERNTGPPELPGAIPTASDGWEVDEGPRLIDPGTIADQIAAIRSGLNSGSRRRP